MTYIVNESCIKCKLMDCVEVCPVDCFYEGENMLVIHPDECIDCGVCEPECPVEAIKPDTEAGAEKWLKLNFEYSKTWPNITVKRAPPAQTLRSGRESRTNFSTSRQIPVRGIKASRYHQLFELTHEAFGRNRLKNGAPVLCYGSSPPEPSAGRATHRRCRRPRCRSPRGWAPYRVRLDPELHAWVAIVIDWVRAA